MTEKTPDYIDKPWLIEENYEYKTIFAQANSSARTDREIEKYACEGFQIHSIIPAGSSSIWLIVMTRRRY